MDIISRLFERGKTDPIRHDQALRLIVGLGNPGGRYTRTRHNAGFIVVDEFARVHSLEWARKKFNAEIAEGTEDGARVLVAKPQAYMNLSGGPVARLLQYFKIPASNLLVVYDDLDLPLGTLRIRPAGGAGGHHGIESIIASVGTSVFARLRFGIGHPSASTRDVVPSTVGEGRRRASAAPNSAADIEHVLSSFDPSERALVEETITRAVAAIDEWLQRGITAAMNKFN